MKMTLKHKNEEFLVMPLKHVLSVMGLVNHPGIPKLWAIAHEKGHKHKNDEFLVMSLEHVLSVMGLYITPEPQNCGHMRTALKRKNDEFLVMSPKHVLSVMGLLNHHRTPKLWE
jgi:hypothetical protein